MQSDDRDAAAQSPASCDAGAQTGVGAIGIAVAITVMTQTNCKYEDTQMADLIFICATLGFSASPFFSRTPAGGFDHV